MDEIKRFAAAAHALDMIDELTDNPTVRDAVVSDLAAPRWATGPVMSDREEIDEDDLLTDAAIRGY